MITPNKNLVFEGGGFKGVAYGGVFEVLEQRQITPQIQSVAGTSAGAINCHHDEPEHVQLNAARTRIPSRLPKGARTIVESGA